MGARRIAFELKARSLRRGAGALYDELLANEQRSPDELASMQDAAAARIARFALSASPYYSELYTAHGISAADLDDPAAWAHLPTTDRTTMKDVADRVWTSEAEPDVVRVARTGGSTGEPLRSGQDARVPLAPLTWRMYRWWGVEPWDHLARIGRWHGSRKETMRNSVSWWPTRHVYADAFGFGPEELEAFLRACRRVRPPLLEVYAGLLPPLAEVAAERGPLWPGLRAVGVTAAPLTPSVRQRAEAVLGAPVYDEYRSSEVQWMAGECREQSGLHVFSDMRRIEVVDDAGRPAAPGEVGDIVVTDLANRVFPVIRYRLGDRGSLRAGACACGLPFPLMDPPDGRVTDLIRLPGGAVIGGGLMALFGDEPAAVRQFQIHQTADYTIHLRVVLGEQADALDAVDRAATKVRERLHGQVPVVVEVVESLPALRGKLQYVVSEVPAGT